MKVKELTEILQKHNPNREIIFSEEEYNEDFINEMKHIEQEKSEKLMMGGYYN